MVTEYLLKVILVQRLVVAGTQYCKLPNDPHWPLLLPLTSSSSPVNESWRNKERPGGKDAEKEDGGGSISPRVCISSFVKYVPLLRLQFLFILGLVITAHVLNNLRGLVSWPERGEVKSSKAVHQIEASRPKQCSRPFKPFRDHLDVEPPVRPS